MPSTRLVSIRDFRANLTKFMREAQEKGVHFVVMRHSTPVAKVSPISREASLELLAEDITKARKDVKQGKVLSVEEVRDILGI